MSKSSRNHYEFYAFCIDSVPIRAYYMQDRYAPTLIRWMFNPIIFRRSFACLRFLPKQLFLSIFQKEKLSVILQNSNFDKMHVRIFD